MKISFVFGTHERNYLRHCLSVQSAWLNFRTFLVATILIISLRLGYASRLYGLECVDSMAKTLTEFDKSSSPHLWKVVEAYTHALTAKYPKYRYVIGIDAHFVTKVLANLPEWMADYAMFKTLPITPAKCKLR